MLALKDTFEKQWQVYCTNDLGTPQTESHQECEESGGGDDHLARN